MIRDIDKFKMEYQRSLERAGVSSTFDMRVELMVGDDDYVKWLKQVDAITRYLEILHYMKQFDSYGYTVAVFICKVFKLSTDDLVQMLVVLLENYAVHTALRDEVDEWMRLVQRDLVMNSSTTPSHN
jgi:hypothetical protein